MFESVVEMVVIFHFFSLSFMHLFFFPLVKHSVDSVVKLFFFFHTCNLTVAGMASVQVQGPPALFAL